MKEESSISHLPEEINTQIFLRLPLESILTCKLVSKQWRNLISDPKFFKLYTPRGSMSLFLYKDDLFCVIPRPHNPLPGTVKGPRHPPFTVHRVPVDLRIGMWSKSPTTPSLLSGSSNGIACVLRERGDLVLHNLFNGTSFTVDPPDDEFELERPDSFPWDCFGSGYNRDGDDYNIVVAQVSYKNQHPEYPEQGELHYKYWEHVVQVEDKDRWFSVYSLRDRAWKQLKGFPFTAEYRWYQPYSRQACAVNGVRQW